MKVGNLIRCSDPPGGFSDETLGVIVGFDNTGVLVKWPNEEIRTHDRGSILWVERF